MLRSRWTAVNDPDPAPASLAEDVGAEGDGTDDDAEDAGRGTALAGENGAGDGNRADDADDAEDADAKKDKPAAAAGRPRKRARTSSTPEHPSGAAQRRKTGPSVRKGAVNVEIQEAKAARDYEAALALQVGGEPHSEAWAQAREIYGKLVKMAVLESKQLKLGPTIKRCALANLAAMDRGAGADDKALDHLVDAICVDDSDPALWEETAALAWKLGNLRLARFAYEQALRGEWSVPPESLWVGLLHVTFALADDAACRQIARYALKQNPRCAWAHLFEEMLAKEASENPGPVNSASEAWPWPAAVELALCAEERDALRLAVTLRRKRVRAGNEGSLSLSLGVKTLHVPPSCALHELIGNLLREYRSELIMRPGLCARIRIAQIAPIAASEVPVKIPSETVRASATKPTPAPAPEPADSKLAAGSDAAKSAATNGKEEDEPPRKRRGGRRRGGSDADAGATSSSNTVAGPSSSASSGPSGGAGPTRSRREATHSEEERLEAALDAILHGTVEQIADFVDPEAKADAGAESDDEPDASDRPAFTPIGVDPQELSRRAKLAPDWDSPALTTRKPRFRQGENLGSTGAETLAMQRWISSLGDRERPTDELLANLLASLHSFDPACFVSTEAQAQSEAQAAAVSQCMDALAIADVDWLATSHNVDNRAGAVLSCDENAIFCAELLYDWSVSPNIPRYLQQRCKRLALVCYSFARQRIPGYVCETQADRDKLTELTLRLEWLAARILALVTGSVGAATKALARCERLLDGVKRQGRCSVVRVPHLQFDATISGDSIAAKRDFLSWRRTIAQVKLEFVQKTLRRDPGLAQRRLQELAAHYLDGLDPVEGGLRQWSDFVMEAQMAESSLEDLHPADLTIESPELAQVQTLNVLENCVAHAAGEAGKARFYDLVARLLGMLVQSVGDATAQAPSNPKLDCERQLLEQCVGILSDNNGRWTPEAWVVAGGGWARIVSALVSKLGKAPENTAIFEALAVAVEHNAACAAQMTEVFLNSLCACALEFGSLLEELANENFVRPTSLIFNTTGRIAATVLAAIKFGPAQIEDEAFCQVATGCIALLLHPSMLVLLRTHAKSKRGVTWASDVALWSLSALLDLCSYGNTEAAAHRRVRGIGLAKMIKPLLKTFAKNLDDRLVASIKGGAARLLADVRTIMALQAQDEDDYMSLEEARQAILSDMLASLYGVIEFSDSPRADKRGVAGGIESGGLASADVLSRLPPRLVTDVTVINCGPATGPKWSAHRSRVMRYLLNYLESRALIDDREYAQSDHTKALVQFVLVRSLAEFGQEAPFEAKVRAFLETPVAELSCDADAMRASCAFITARESFLEPRQRPKPATQVTAKELCERLPLSYAELVHAATPAKLPRLNAPASDDSLADYCGKLEAGLEALRLDLGFNPWRFMSWFKLGDLGSRLQRIAMSSPQICSAMLDLLDAPAKPSGPDSCAAASETESDPEAAAAEQRQRQQQEHLRVATERPFVLPVQAWKAAIMVAQAALAEAESDERSLRASDRVKAKFRKGDPEQAIITRINDDGTFDLCYEGEDELDFAMPRETLEALSPELARVEPENPDESTFDCLMTIGSFVFANLGCLRRVDNALYVRACQLARSAFQWALRLREQKQEADVLFLHARAREKCGAEPIESVLQEYAKALDVAPDKGDDMAICKTEIRYRIYATRIKKLFAESCGPSGASDANARAELKDLLEGLASCFGKDCERENHRAVHRYALAVLEAPRSLLPDAERAAWLERAASEMRRTFEKKAGERVCVIRYPEYTIKFDYIARPWWKMEVTRFKHIRLYLRLCRALGDFDKARHFFSVLMDTMADRNKKDKDPNAATLLRGACLCITEMVGILGSAANSTDPTDQKALLGRAFAVYVESVDLLAALKGHPGLRERKSLSSAADFLLRAYALTTGKEAPALKTVVKTCEERFPSTKATSRRRGKSRASSNKANEPKQPQSASESKQKKAGEPTPVQPQPQPQPQISEPRQEADA